MSIFRQGHWDAGAGLVGSDLTNISHFLRSQVFDTLGAFARINENDVVPSATHAWCFGNSAAPYSESGLTIKNLAGPLAQQASGSVDGDAAKMVVYYVEADELETTFGAADGSNPRIDLIAIKIDVVDGPTESRHFKDATTGALTTTSQVVTKDARLELTAVAGTPAATPAEPAVPSGYVKYCSVYIPAGATTILAPNISDHRMPVGLSAVDVYPPEFIYDDASWLLATTVGSGSRHQVSNQIGVTPLLPLYGYIKGLHGSGRLVAVGFSGVFTAGAAGSTYILGRRDLISLDPFVGVEQMEESALTCDGVARYTQAAVASPVWTNGYRAGHANTPGFGSFSLTAGTWDRLGLRIMPDSGIATQVMFVRFIRFIVAGM